MALQIALLEESFQQIAPVKEDFAKAFYNRLFAQSPHIQAFFINTDMQLQQNKLMASLALVLSNLRQPDKLIETLQELGQQLETYHVQPEHYSLAETALLETFAQFLQAQWTRELHVAWTEAYRAIVSLMLEGYTSPLVAEESIPTSPHTSG